MVMVGLYVVVVVGRRASPDRAAVRQNTRVKDPTLWGKRVAFYALIALCLTIPSGWTRQVLEASRREKEPRRLRKRVTVVVAASVFSLVDARLLLLAFYGGLDAAGIGEGHPFESVDASGVSLYGEGAVDQALDTNRRDVLDAYGLDVLSLPSASQLHPVGVYYNDVVAVCCGLGNGSPV